MLKFGANISGMARLFGFSNTSRKAEKECGVGNAAWVAGDIFFFGKTAGKAGTRF